MCQQIVVHFGLKLSLSRSKKRKKKTVCVEAFYKEKSEDKQEK